MDLNKSLGEMIGRDKKTDELCFFNGMLSREEHVLKSESGLFYSDGNGIVQRFEPARDNLFFDEDIEKTDNYTYKPEFDFE